MLNITVFDTKKHHIYLDTKLNIQGAMYDCLAILDTGAPRTELSLRFLLNTGILHQDSLKDKQIKLNIPSQKVGKLKIPSLEICNHKIHDMEVFISVFDSFWAVDALIGLDFFKKFKVSIDYSKGIIETEEFGKM